MRASYTRQIGDIYQRWEAETTLDRESEVHVTNMVETLFRRITHEPEMIDATAFGGPKTELPTEK